ncbi:MAG: protein kinase, partial [Actinomycetota bacterium]
TSLMRTVAVKILLPQLADDPYVSRRFREETIAVAALHHPHLTRVFDSGHDNGLTYVVTEYLGGGSLRSILNESSSRGTLSESLTARIGLEAADGLAYAHERGFVHGAIRPSKILFDLDGRVRVSDLGFGGVTRTASLDELRYTSPEQVVGAEATEASDVYSLSLTLYECLTGEIAHNGATAEEIRQNRIGSPLPQSKSLGALDIILALGAAYDPAARPNATRFHGRMEAVASSLPRPAALRLPTSDFRAPTADEVVSGTAAPAPLRDGSDGATPTPVVRPLDGWASEERLAPQRRRRSRSFRPSRVIAVAGGLSIVIIAAAWGLGFFTPTHPVPSLVNLTSAQAATLLKNDNFTLSISQHAQSDSVAANAIIQQTPSAGTVEKEGSTIAVVVSDGPQSVSLPSGLVGMDCATATQKLAALGITANCPTSSSIYSSSIPAGQVAALSWNGAINPSSVAVNATVTLALSQGPQPGVTTTTTVPGGHGPRAVPTLAGLTRAQVLSAMHDAELYFATTGPGSTSGTWSTAVTTTPPAGSMVPWHSTVRVKVR